MTTDSANDLVVGALVVTGIVVTVRDLAHGKRPSLGLPIGLTIVGMMLAAASDFAPDLAGGFAVLLALGALLRTGSDSLPAIRKAVSVQ